MKSFLIIISILLCLINPLRSQTLSPNITFTERSHDFGSILEKKGKVSHVFIFHNSGTKPVVIDEIESGCGCIGRVLSKTPVKPGGQGKVTIIFNPSYKSGSFDKEIMVFSNKGQNYTRIWITGKVIPFEHPVEEDYPYNFGNGLHLRLKVIAFGYFKAGETKQMELNYANGTNQKMTLSFKIEGNAGNLNFTSPGIISPKARGVMTFSYTMPRFGGKDVVYTVHPYMNNKRLPENLTIKILKQN
jgi:hypothetical protein